MIFGLFVILGIFLALVIIGKGLKRDSKGEPTGIESRNVVIAVVTAFVCAVLGDMLSGSVGIIQPGAVGVVVHLGKVDKSHVIGEGPYFVTPFISRVVAMDVQTRAFQANAEAASKDLQTVNTQVTVNYNLEPKQAPEIYDTLRNDYSDRIIAPAIQETVKASTAPFNAEELITRRATVRNLIDSTLKAKLAPFGINVVAISVSDFKFSDQFNQAVEAKVTAQQNALTEQANLAAAKFKAQQTMAQADADAYKQRVMKQELTPEMVQWEAIQKWDGHLPTYSGSQIPFIGVK